MKKQETAGMQAGMDRRSFLKTTGLVAGGMGAFALAGCGQPTVKEAAVSGETTGEATGATETTPVLERVTEELPIPDAKAPATTSYDCDVLVIGGGFAGLNAAMAAKAANSKVVLIDKGRPGYSGLSPWPSSHRWFDASMGDDEESFKKCIQMGSEYVGNVTSYQSWIDNSKAAYERLAGWGIMDRFDRCADTKYWDTLDYQGYRDEYLSKDRHKRFAELLKENNIDFADYTMITDVIVEDNHVVGAMGFHVPSGTIIKINAKAIVMAMGGGCYKPSGYPVGGNTFDGEYIAYNLGLPIVGKEYDDFHSTSSLAPGLAFMTCSWDYLENIWLCGGDITPEGWEDYAVSKQKIMVINRVTNTINGLAANDGVSQIEDQANGSITRRGGTAYGNPDDLRIGKFVSPKPKGDCYGAAVGMHAHFSCGVWCGFDDIEGKTSIEGLWVAGDGINGCGVTGADYPVGVGFTSNFASIQGDLAGKAAAAFASTAPAQAISAEKEAEITESILAPMKLTKGFSADWARDQLQAIMAPWYVNVARDEATLQAALVQVINLRDKVVPKLMAVDPHQLRMAIEMKHKVNSAEMKLRAQIERKESRGAHYRTDYPYRDDKNWLAYLAVKKTDAGMELEKIMLPTEWVGDTTMDYAKRYQTRFPGEAKALGLPEESSSSSGGWGK